MKLRDEELDHLLDDKEEWIQFNETIQPSDGTQGNDMTS